MKIAIMQLAPKLGDRAGNIERANSIIHSAERQQSLQGIDLLVLPEMAFSGYNFQSLKAITPFLEPTAQGPSTEWAKQTAIRLKCCVIVGYPETLYDASGTNYNSQVMVNREGEIIKHHRKAFLYYTDEAWAQEGEDGWLLTSHPELDSELQDVVFGICMDINPYKFEAPWEACEFATFCMKENARVIVLSMAWLTRLGLEELLEEPNTPDRDTVNYWYARFSPLLRRYNKDDVFVVFANRCGIEPGDPNGAFKCDPSGHVAYAGSSCVMKFNKYGAFLYSMMGRSTEGLLLTDTSDQPGYTIGRV